MMENNIEDLSNLHPKDQAGIEPWTTRLLVNVLNHCTTALMSYFACVLCAQEARAKLAELRQPLATRNVFKIVNNRTAITIEALTVKTKILVFGYFW